MAKLKIRCTQSLGRQPSHALLNSAEKIYFTGRSNGNSFDGLWSEAVIEGNHLQFHGSSLPLPVLEVTSSNAFTMTMRSDFPDEEFAVIVSRQKFCLMANCIGMTGTFGSDVLDA